jgi:hypothetical protein
MRDAVMRDAVMRDAVMRDQRSCYVSHFTIQANSYISDGPLKIISDVYSMCFIEQ